MTAVLLLATTACAAAEAERPAAEAAKIAVVDSRPNVVMVLTDDMREDDLRWMPHTRRILEAGGRRFVKATSPHPLCCPARAEILTGQYAQNNGVRHNHGRHGGYLAIDPRNTVGTWLQRSGYNTGLIGKHLNQYYQRYGRDPGWTVFKPLVEGTATYTDFMFFHEGHRYEDNYVTDRIADRTVQAIRTFSRSGKPFLVLANHLAPHDRQDARGSYDPVVAKRHRTYYPHAVSPSFRDPSFNEADMSDKTPGERMRAQVDRTRIQQKFKKRIQSLAAVDEAVLRIYKTLRRTGELHNTYLIFTSDNGYLLGEHRGVGKNVLNARALDIPLLIRGPGLRAGSKATRPASLVDLAPTIADIANVRPGRRVDGRSLLGSPVHRDTTLIQTGTTWSSDRPEQWRFRGVMTNRYIYGYDVKRPRVTFLYDRRVDPYELVNKVYDPAYRAVRDQLNWRYRVLKNCSGPAQCNRVFGPLPTPGR